MITIHNQKDLKQRRRDLRNTATPQEIILWVRLLGSQCGFKFRRQHSIGNYIVDFYCPEKKVAVEIDGSQHDHSKNAEYDLRRTEYLKSLGIKALRFWNNEVNTNIEGVMMRIEETLTPTTPPRRLGTPPW